MLGEIVKVIYIVEIVWGSWMIFFWFNVEFNMYFMCIVFSLVNWYVIILFYLIFVYIMFIYNLLMNVEIRSIRIIVIK